MSLKLTLLGTGTPLPSARRVGSSYLVQFAGQCLLFDCGPGSHYRLLQTGTAPTEVSHLFLTHLHYDHCADYATLELVRWDQAVGRIDELSVIGPAGTSRMSERIFGEDGVFAADIQARTQHVASREVYESRGGQGARQPPAPRVIEIGDGMVYTGNEWCVRTAQVVHCEPYVMTLAYRLETRFGTVVFGADTAPTSRLTELARGADVLVHMCHFLNRPGVDQRISKSCSGHLDAATTARDAGAHQLVLVHLTPEVEAPANRERILTEAQAIFGGEIIFGEDLLEIPVVRRESATDVTS
jgi:ribonuclease Z